MWLLLIVCLGLGLRLTGLWWGQGYSYFCQGDGVEAYSTAIDYGQGEAKAQYLGQPNFNEHSKLPGPLWTLFCFGALRFWGSIQGVMLTMILLNTAAIWLTYLLAQRTLGPPAAIWAALLAATLPSAVYYSVGAYNPDVMPFLGALLLLALWEAVQHDRSPHIFWVGLLLLMMPQFHMSGLTLWLAAGLVLALSSTPLNWLWLLGGLLAGASLYLPYLRGEIAHGWQNTLGMVSGRGGHSWDSLKSVSTPLNLLINWVPQWTRGAAEYRELGRACFGWFGVCLAVNLVSIVTAGFLIVGAFQRIRAALCGCCRSPRETFRRSPGIVFLSVMLLAPLLAALVSGRPFHARYALVLFPPLLALAGLGAVQSLVWRRVGRICAAALVVTLCVNVWFMPALYRHQGARIDRGAAFMPSFRKLEGVYRQLRDHAGADRSVRVDDAAYLDAVPRGDMIHRDAALIRRYVAVREKEAQALSINPRPLVIYRLCRADEVAEGDTRVAYQSQGIALVAP